MYGNAQRLRAHHGTLYTYMAAIACSQHDAVKTNCKHAYVLVQRFARMVIGLEPVEFNSYYQKDVCAGAWDYLFAGDIRYMWAHENGFNQWWIDELTIDPQKLITDEEGYPLKAELKDVVLESDMVNASIGSVPSTQVILCMHAEHGCMAFFPALGLKRGRQDSQQGVSVWLDNLSAEDQEKIKQRTWYCHPDAVKKMQNNGTPGQKMDFDSEFTKRNFLVRTCINLH